VLVIFLLYMGYIFLLFKTLIYTDADLFKFNIADFYYLC